MSAVTGLVGLGGGAGGTSFQGPQQADPTGLNNLQTTYNGLQQIASGQGPNPAQLQYQQNVNNLAQQQAGAISSVQGISPALAARMISQQGSAANQNAAAAGATNTANQQLGALGQMGNVAGAQASNITNMQSNINSANAGLSQAQMGGQQQVIGGIASGAAKGIAMAAGGGMIQRMADGGAAGDPFATPPMTTSPAAGPQSGFAKFLQGATAQSPAPQAAPQQPLFNAASSLGQGIGKGIGSMFSSGPENQGQGPVAQAAPAPSIGGTSVYTSPSYATDIMNAPTGMAQGGMTHDYRDGGGVKAKTPAQKAVKSGNSYANDKIPAVLSEGEVVIPRSVMQGKDPARGAAQFVQAVLAKKKVTGRL